VDFDTEIVLDKKYNIDPSAVPMSKNKMQHPDNILLTGASVRQYYCDLEIVSLLS
jgi:hypothetical protein